MPMDKMNRNRKAMKSPPQMPGEKKPTHCQARPNVLNSVVVVSKFGWIWILSKINSSFREGAFILSSKHAKEAVPAAIILWTGCNCILSAEYVALYTSHVPADITISITNWILPATKLKPIYGATKSVFVMFIVWMSIDVTTLSITTWSPFNANKMYFLSVSWMTLCGTTAVVFVSIVWRVLRLKLLPEYSWFNEIRLLVDCRCLMWDYTYKRWISCCINSNNMFILCCNWIVYFIDNFIMNCIVFNALNVIQINEKDIAHCWINIFTQFTIITQ